MKGVVDWRAATFGILLGCSMLLIYCGLRVVPHESLNDRARRRGMWTLNCGIALAAISMCSITLIGSV